jgi:hypothetical protein
MPSSPEVYPCVFCPHVRSVLSRLIYSFLLVVVISATASVATAQSPTATLIGTVTDQNEAVIPGVNIAVIPA